MPLSVGLVLVFMLVFMLGFWSGMAWIRASRADRSEKLVKTIASLRAERDTARRALDTLMEVDDDAMLVSALELLVKRCEERDAALANVDRLRAELSRERLGNLAEWLFEDES